LTAASFLAFKNCFDAENALKWFAAGALPYSYRPNWGAHGAPPRPIVGCQLFCPDPGGGGVT